MRNIATGIAANQPVSGTAGIGDESYTAPGPYIPIGQGFFITGSGDGGTITFNNAQREYKQEGDDAIFYKNGGSTGANTSVLKLGLDYMHQEENTMFHRQVGISFMEGLAEWHNRMPNQRQEAIARAELGLEREQEVDG